MEIAQGFQFHCMCHLGTVGQNNSEYTAGSSLALEENDFVT